MRRPESLTAVVMPLLALATACTSPSTHVLVGNAFDPGARCLQPSAGFDVVDGPEPSADCSPACVIDARTATAYVTVVCPPYPPLDTAELADASTGSADPCPSARQ